MALRPGGMTDEEFQRLNPAAPASAKAGAAVGQSLRTAGNFGMELVREQVKPLKAGINAFGGAIDAGLDAAGNFAASAVAGRPVQANRPTTDLVRTPAPARAQAPVVPAAPATQARKAPSDVMTPNEAHATEVNARTSTQSSTSRQSDVGASAPAGGAAPSSFFIGSNGVKRTINQDGTIAGADPNRITVNSQSFGTAAQPAAAPAPLLNRGGGGYGASFAPQVAPQADAAGINAAAKADEQLRSAIDSQLFRLSFAAGRPGRDGRAAKQAMADLIGLQGRSIEGQGRRAVDIAGGDRDAELGNNRIGADLATSDADRALRADQGAADIQLRRDGLAADGRSVKQTLTGEDGGVSLLRGDGSLTPATNPDGTPFKSPALDRGQVTQRDRLEFLQKRIGGIEEAMASARSLNPGADVSMFEKQLNALNAQAESMLPKEPGSAHIALLKSKPETADQFDEEFGKGAAARILGAK